MDSENSLSKFKDIIDNIIKIENNYNDKILKLHYKNQPDNRNIMRIIRYLNFTDWKNFKFNEYSVKKNDDNYIIILNYISPKVII